MKFHLFALPLLLGLLGASCAPPPTGSSASADKHAVALAPVTAAIPPPASMQPPSTDPANAPPQTSPILVVPLSKPVSSPPAPAASAATTGTVDSACRTSADCAVKNVGSCCGQYPACVNRNSRTFPEQVRAQCAQEHRMGVCGFPSISGCECVAGKCEAQTGVAADPNVR